jgi:hypothetical protein
VELLKRTKQRCAARYAYVGSSPLTFIDQFGLSASQNGLTITVQVWDSALDDLDGLSGDGGCAGRGCSGSISVRQDQPGTNPEDINATWSKTFPCNKNAQQVMSAVENDMCQFADNRGYVFAANFPNQLLSVGSQYAIQPGSNSHSGGGAQGGILPTGTLAVTVTSSNLFWAALGLLIKAGENSTWNNMIGVLKQPGLKASAGGIELIYCTKYIQEDALDRFLGFAIIAQNSTRYAEDESTVSFKQNGQCIVAAPA